MTQGGFVVPVSALARNLLTSIVTVLAVIVFNFTLIHLAPGDPVTVMVGEMGGGDPELITRLQQQYGLDRPFAEQLFTYVLSVLTGDLGFSFYYNMPVLDLILQRLPATLLLVVSALCLAIVIGTALGVVAAQRPRGILSHLITVISIAGFSAPVFWVGIVLIIGLASALPIFPTSGMRDVTNIGAGIWGDTVDVAYHLVLPAFTLATVYLAQYSRLARSSMLEVLSADYVRTARAKGLPERLVVYKHALRNAVLPVVTIAGLQFGQVVAGAVLVETVFAWPGLGRLAYESILRRDSPTMLGILLFSAVIVIVANIVTDMVYRMIDPRIGARA
ncbi:ABC transporter permease [Pseudaminobacter arsenicus]|uniref:ABC transporter permease n=1 Tax=Borborobacter arsenicus TaxID=1851146 RepID=A0A432VBN5_9HYPH|nr:ABC transporter permease [Pseudaminobacter arsenicus]RUM99536.1 ABC transporter permease [Pseudaminobacter arsenicus]